MKKSKGIMKYKKSIVSVLIAILICSSFQITAYAANVGYDVNMTGKNNYTLCTGTKTTNDDWVTFYPLTGATLNMWAGHYNSGIVLTQTIIVKTTNTNGLKAYYKMFHSAEKGDKLRARAELYTSSSSIKNCVGAVDFR